MIGYFGGYISKKQKVGRFELKQSVAAQPYFHKKLMKKTNLFGRESTGACVQQTFHESRREGGVALRSGRVHALF